MSSLQISAEDFAVSAKPVATYEKIWDGGAVVEIKVPARVNDGVFDRGEVRIPFLQFARNVSGGMVNMFVHTTDKSICGKVISAQVSIWRKTIEDGRSFLHVDLKPVSRSTKITHRLTVVPTDPEISGTDGWLVFETPKPLRGTIVLAPPEAKMIQL